MKSSQYALPTEASTASNGPKTRLSERRRKIINAVFRLLMVDYGERFTRQFRDGLLTHDKWKWRLAMKTTGLSDSAILDGADAAIAANPERVPTIPMLVTAMTEVWQTEQREIRLRREAASLARPSVPSQPGKPLDIPRPASLPQFHSREEMARLLRDHEVLLAAMPDRRREIPPEHRCPVPECGKPGSISAGLRGGGKLYCREHARL